MERLLYLLPVLLVLLNACKPEEPEALRMVKNSLQPSMKTDPATSEVSLVFSEEVEIALSDGAQLNGETVAVAAKGRTLAVTVLLAPKSEYVLTVKKGTVKGLKTGGVNNDLEISFTTTASASAEGIDALCTPSPSKEAQNLYDYLLSQYGNHILSATMAAVNWNTNEAEWVNYHTGKYPAITCFDLIQAEMNESWAQKIYSSYSAYEDWWANNGIIAGMWHQLVPKTEGTEAGSNTGTYSPSETTFRAANALVEGTWENTFYVADVDKAAEVLKGFRDRNIPVLWRPYHEAAGKWFWWGSDAETHKALWKYMWDRFVNHHGLNNLIWVWTTQGDDSSWYPGDEYVDIIGRDIYGKSSGTYFSGCYEKDKKAHPNKMITLSECGRNNYSLASLSDQWNSGAHWSWFMPWYDNKLTKTANTASYYFTDPDKANEHAHMPIDYWKEALQMEQVITRDEVPSLK